MAKTLIPTSDAEFANFLSNLGTKLAPLATTLGLSAGDAAAVTRCHEHAGGGERSTVPSHRRQRFH